MMLSLRARARRGRYCSRALLEKLLVVALAGLPSPASADEGDVINAFAGAGLGHDSNVFRYPDAAVSLPGGGSVFLPAESDTIRNAYLGVTLDKALGRQRVQANYSIGTIRYQRFSYLDNDPQSGRAAWIWQAGNRWQGELSADYDRVLTEFVDFRLPVRNITTTWRGKASAGYRYHPDWEARAIATTATSDNSTAVRAGNDYDQTGAELGIRYLPRSGNWIGLALRHTETVYPNARFNDIAKDDLQVQARWSIGGHSRLDLRAGYTDLQHDQFAQRDFSGPTGRLDYDWTLSGKSAVSVIARRELSGYETSISSFVDTRAIAIAPSWNPTAKTSLRLRYEHQWKEYRGDPAVIVAGVPRRDDRIGTLALTASYAPWRFLQLTLELRREDRDSNDPRFLYDASTAQGTLQVLY